MDYASVQVVPIFSRHYLWTYSVFLSLILSLILGGSKDNYAPKEMQ